MFTTLFSKVFVILSIQLFITFLTAFGYVAYCRKAYKEGADWIFAESEEDGELDLMLAECPKNKRLYWGSMIAFVVLFIILLLVKDNLLAAMIIFGLWSITTGLMVGMSLMFVNENLGVLVLGITASVTFVTALIGMYSGIDFSFMGKYLFILLIILIIINIIRLFVNIKGLARKLISLFGVILFTMYLIYDFNKIKTGSNDWNTAIDISMEIYLDIINLFLEILDLLSSN